MWTPNTMKARETVFSLVAGSPCPRTIYFNSLSQPLGEEFSGRSIHPSIKCRISLVISIIEDRSNQFFPITFFAFKIYMSSLKVNYLCSAVLPEIWIKMNIWSQNEQSWHFWYQIFSQPSDSTRLLPSSLPSEFLLWDPTCSFPEWTKA